MHAPSYRRILHRGDFGSEAKYCNCHCDAIYYRLIGVFVRLNYPDFDWGCVFSIMLLILNWRLMLR